MKFFKSNFKLIVGFLIGAILTGGIVYAATTATQVSYTRSGTSVNNVEEALNDLYNKKGHKESGSIDITYTHNWQYQTITFENEYESAPDVFYEYAAGNTGGSVYVKNITTTSFEIGYNSFFNTLHSDTIKWVAIEK